MKNTKFIALCCFLGMVFSLKLNAQEPVFRAKLNRQVTAPVNTVPVYRESNWGTWGKVNTVEYRYKWGLKTNDDLYKTNVDVTFEIHNPTARAWKGILYVSKCNGEREKKMVIQVEAGATQQFTMLAPNCGTVEQPRVKQLLEWYRLID